MGVNEMLSMLGIEKIKGIKNMIVMQKMTVMKDMIVKEEGENRRKRED